MKTYRRLPPVLRSWFLDYGAWLVGSGVDWYLSKDQPPPRDLDVIIPPQHWQSAVRRVEGRIRTTSFGGLTTDMNHVSVDFWPSHLEEFFSARMRLDGRPLVRKALRLWPYTLITEVW